MKNVKAAHRAVTENSHTTRREKRRPRIAESASSRPGSTTVATLSIAFTILTLAVAGCGGGGKSTNTPSGAGTSGTVDSPVGRAEGSVTLNLPARPGGTSRLVPAASQWVKVQFFDVDESGKRVALPLYKENGAPYGGTADIVKFDDKPSPRSYYYLPLKNLTIRVAAYASDPTNGDEVANPPLALVEVPFRPQRLKAGTANPQITLEMASNLTDLAIVSKAVADPEGEGIAPTSDVNTTRPVSLTLGLIPTIGNAIALIDPKQALKRVEWSVESVSGPPIEQIADWTPNEEDLTLRLTAKGDRPGVIRVTARDAESGRVTSKELSVRPRAGKLDVQLFHPPFGTRSVKVVIEPPARTGVTAQTFIAPWPVALSKDDATQPDPNSVLKDFTNKIALPASGASDDSDKALVSIWVYAGDNATGEILYERKSIRQTIRSGGFTATSPDKIDTLPGDLSANSEKPTPQIDLYVVSGKQYASGQSTLQDIPENTRFSAVTLVSGQRYALTVGYRDGTGTFVHLPTSGFTLTRPQKSASRIDELTTDPNDPYTFSLKVFSLTSDYPGTAYSGQYTLQESSGTRSIRTFGTPILADFGGQIGLQVR